ncbi:MULTISPECIES: D-glycero-beta-D-manno-heptose 1-phosphate adenylyltransferase [unclassified Thermosynechococcus]|uniref:D-glycero-beta-D-manno-heptose 1-phosphate adenylyltransferase n=1 Tax=unclassified Thermosynechococcus TaxID=2622553 RepID=UPI001CED650F|nr:MULTISPECIES: D-glycero-beta-D-manno-heptose 1-phosphate adenylyltransferase [unclassified Thermosynechococcus]MDR7897847.1 D-glycero-beta-D-manno-heptose 1-phosphate adenylyltransferase [Thermosynechococcus sp. JY1332]MDR7905246.1 D-glycero-beta-D-manno-heptose 1-phosphate adenylyltransferase [Thermosynechococcus sp. JY1334]MDR7993071.1 D-glycero-beta-D-manno-heptose 1-phosphate adenylyltransferase [Thermosynechococcus sp. TG252]WKT87462.1 D-glycero-beta-D-manno-heptose 1-phosphate adenylyl
MAHSVSVLRRSPLNLYTLEALVATINAAPQDWRPLVFTNGCFDLIHAGHVRYLAAARALGKRLVVGLNSDRSVATLKPKRPIIPEQQRAEVLASLRSVDAVLLFSDRTATTLIEVLQPEIYVKGGDYQLETLPEAAAVQRYGGRIELIQVEVPSSTTAIVQRILELHGEESPGAWSPQNQP